MNNKIVLIRDDQLLMRKLISTKLDSIQGRENLHCLPAAQLTPQEEFNTKVLPIHLMFEWN